MKPNPLYEIWAKLHEGTTSDYGMTKFPGSMREQAQRQVKATIGRDRCVDLFSWAIPTSEVIEALAQFSPIVEIGCGRGYWADLLQKAGADVRAYDSAPPQKSNNNVYHKTHKEGFPRAFSRVLFGNQAVLYDMDPARALFLCWPPYDTSMGYECLTAYQGDTVIYIGEGRGGCTGDDQFHALLESDWDSSLEFDIPTWWGIRDFVSVYNRKKA
jgi:hypothetical protein